MSDEKAGDVVHAVDNLVATVPEYVDSHEVNPGTARFMAIDSQIGIAQDIRRLDKT